MSFLLPLGEEGDGTCGVQAGARAAFGWEAEPVKPLERGALRRWLWITKELIGEEGELSLCGDAGILLSQRAGGRVARIGVELQPLLFARHVQRSECLLRHVDLTAHLGVYWFAQLLRDHTDRAHVRRHVFTR